MKDVPSTPQTPRHLFDVIIEKNTRAVYSIEGRDHEGLNGEPTSWWIYMAEKPPTPDVVPPPDSEDFKPWHKSILRHCWDITFKERNTTKIKYDEMQFRHHLTCSMICNGKLVYEFGTFDMQYAMAKAQVVMVQMGEHTYNFFEPEKNKGRKVFFHGMPVFVDPKHNGWEVAFIPDYSEIPKDEWWRMFNQKRTLETQKKDEDDMDIFEDDLNAGYINWGDALSDQYINWHRK